MSDSPGLGNRGYATVTVATLILGTLIVPSTSTAKMPGMGLIPEPYDEIVPLTHPTEMSSSLPMSLDWRNGGYVTPAKHQGSCGGCWAFAAVAALEAACVMAGAPPSIDLSEQHPISCDSQNRGCCGGGASVFDFLTGGVAQEESFAYAEGDAEGCGGGSPVPCGDPAQSGWRVSSWGWVNGGSIPSVDQMKEAIANYGPIWAGFVVYEDFIDGRGGGYWYNGSETVPYCHVRGQGDRVGAHAVLVIGYDDQHACWIAKNSWGETAGPSGDGTFRVAYDSGCYFGLNAAWVTAELYVLPAPIQETTWGQIKARFLD